MVRIDRPGQARQLHRLQVPRADPPHNKPDPSVTGFWDDIGDEAFPTFVSLSPLEQDAGPAAGVTWRVDDPAVAPSGVDRSAACRTGLGHRPTPADAVAQGHPVAATHPSGHTCTVPCDSN
jgi:hypothetical protein